MIRFNDFSIKNLGSLCRADRIRTMKTQPILSRAGALWRLACLTALLALTGFAGIDSARAASVNPPDLMTYQGYLADGTGVPLGSTAPVNHNVVFRIYDAQSGGNLLWSEVQTVTVDNGQFSVVLGEGAQYQSEARDPLGTVFRGVTVSDRFMEMNVTIGGNALTIAPRLRFLPSPYAFLAKQANALVSPDGATLVTTANGQLNVNGVISNSGAVANSATTATDGNLANRIVLRNAAGNFSANEIVLGTAITVPNVNAGHLHANTISGSHGQGAHLEWNHYGGGETWLLNQKGLGTGGIFFGEVDAARGITERMRIDGAGRLGVGTAGPSAALHVESNASTHNPFGVAYFRATHINGGAWGSHINYGGTGDWYIRSSHPSGRIVLQDTGGNVGIGTAGPANRLSVLGTADISGNLGIGVVNPTQKLDVNGTGRFAGGVQVGSGAQAGLYGDGGNIAIRTYPGGGLYFQSHAGARTPLYIGPDDKSTFHGSAVVDNYLSVGTTAQHGQLTVAGGVSHNGIYGPYLNTAGYGGPFLHGAHTISIYAQGGVWTRDFFVASSDERIKRIQGQSDSSADLRTLMGIEITDYTYKDVLARGSAPQKKVIAQQLEKVFPQAVNMQTNAVPDIYQRASVEDGWVSLATDLKEGDRVRLIYDKNVDQVFDVLEVEEDRFRVDFKPEEPGVFVYGRVVDDFRTVEYDAISMLNVSATQELARQVAELRKSEVRIAELEKTVARIDELEEKAGRVDSLEREVADLKKLVARIAGVSPPAKATGENEPAARK